MTEHPESGSAAPSEDPRIGSLPQAGPGRSTHQILAEMAANVWKVVVADGDHVTPGTELVILESMKMEIPVEATAAGTVTITVAEGGSVQEGDLIATIDG